MSQPADWGVPGTGPATPTAYASRDNGSFDALLSQHIGASRPSYAVQGTFWLKDTGASPQVIEKYFYDGTNDILIASFDVATSKVSFTKFVGSAVASAATIVIPSDGEYFSLTGSTTVSTMTVAINRSFTLKSASGLTLTAGAPIVTIDGNDLVLAAGQTVILQSTAANVVQVVSVGSVGNSSGRAVQIVEDVDGALATGTTILPHDNTTPQNTEGDEYLSVAITPTDAASTLIIEALVHIGGSNTSPRAAAALFQDSTANALATGWLRMGAQSNPASQIELTHTMAAGTTSATTFKIRAGQSVSGTTTFNGLSGAPFYNGTIVSFLRITEITP